MVITLHIYNILTLRRVEDRGCLLVEGERNSCLVPEPSTEYVRDPLLLEDRQEFCESPTPEVKVQGACLSMRPEQEINPARISVT